jgi:hypothetical protein
MRTFLLSDKEAAAFVKRIFSQEFVNWACSKQRTKVIAGRAISIERESIAGSFVSDACHLQCETITSSG